MKLFVYNYRDYEEKTYVDRYAEEFGVEVIELSGDEPQG